MIKRLQLLRNIGQFDSVSSGANVPLNHLTLFYSENGRGKTTLAAIFRSLATGNPLPISERSRLAAPNPPHVVIDCDGGPPAAIFENNVWNRSGMNVVIFDDVFIDENVHSGLAVQTRHRQNLHEWILGAEAVTLSRELDQLVKKIEEHNKDLRIKERAIPAKDMGPFSVGEFCALAERTDIDEAIQEAQRSVAAARDQDSIRTTPQIELLALPEFDLAAIESILDKNPLTIDSQTLAQVGEHLARLGPGGEAWVADGIRHAALGNDGGAAEPCPFCAQDLKDSPVVQNYRLYFSAAYLDLKKSISASLASMNRMHDGNAQAGFERSVRVAIERLQFWSRFCKVPALEVDTAPIVRDWRAAWDAVAASLSAKQAAPLERLELSTEAARLVTAYGTHCQTVAAANGRVGEANHAIALAKEQAASANLSVLESDLVRLRAIKARHEPETAALCDEYLAERASKTETERRRDQVKAKLEQHRESAFPNHENAINAYLAKFNAGFRLEQMTYADNRGGATCTYNVLINEISVPVGTAEATPGAPSFRNTLSAGDRNTLALAFFFASLDLDSKLARKVVVIDDPISSLDEHRALTTVQEVRRLVERAEQVIVLSHDKAFLLRLWQGAGSARTAVEVVREGSGSTIRVWDVARDVMTEHDRRHVQMREFLATGAGGPREVARSIRPHVEGFLRVACPQQFGPDTLLGPFLSVCEQRLGTKEEILDAAAIEELRDLNEYGSRYHHQGWETEPINDSELRGFVERTLRFARP